MLNKFFKLTLYLVPGRGSRPVKPEDLFRKKDVAKASVLYLFHFILVFLITFISIFKLPTFGITDRFTFIIIYVPAFIMLCTLYTYLVVRISGIKMKKN